MMKMVLDLIGLLGGVGAIIVGISAFTSKLWADWFMKKKTIEYDKQIALYKDTLEIEREKYKAIYDQMIYKNKLVFDAEFKIYQKLTPIIMDIRWSSVKAMGKYPYNKEMEDRYNEAIVKCKEAISLTLNYIALMDKDVYNKYANFILLCMNNMEDIRQGRYSTGKYEAELHFKIAQIEKESDLVIDVTREYLRGMSIIK